MPLEKCNVNCGLSGKFISHFFMSIFAFINKQAKLTYNSSHSYTD
jgi:hypothetical protein